MSVAVSRIVLAIDTADRTVHIVREAVELASRFEVELEGMFVEDDALLALARHDFARRYGRWGTAQAFEPDEIEREWRAIARDVRRELEREAEKRHVHVHMTVMRGAVESLLRARLARDELVVVAWGGWLVPGAGAPVRVLYDGEGAHRALEIAVRLAGERGTLLVWVAPDHRRAIEAAMSVREVVGGRVAQLRIAGLPDATPATLRRAIAEEPGGVLLLPAGHELAAQVARRSLSARFPCSVILVS